MNETVRMMKIADVHPDEVEELVRHGWVVADDAERLDEDVPTQAHGNDGQPAQEAADMDVKPAPRRGAKK